MIGKAIANNLSLTMTTNKIFFIFDKFLLATQPWEGRVLPLNHTRNTNRGFVRYFFTIDPD